MNEIYHIPAMLRETIQGLNIQPNGLYVDVTFGGGGHSRAILEAMRRKASYIPLIRIWMHCTMQSNRGW